MRPRPVQRATRAAATAIARRPHAAQGPPTHSSSYHHSPQFSPLLSCVPPESPLHGGISACNQLESSDPGGSAGHDAASTYRSKGGD